MSPLDKTHESITNALAALEAETQEVVQESIRLNDNLVKAGNKIWRQVLVIWGVSIVLAVSYFSVLHYQFIPANQTPERPASQENAGSNPASGQAPEPAQLPSTVLPAAPVISEHEDLNNLLTKIREAQLKKDIQLFMESYSPDFPEVSQKKETMLSIWKKYTYLDSQFKLIDLQQETPTTTLGKVIWNIKVQDQKNGSIRTLRKTYQVTFSKKSGKWLIYNLKTIDNIKSD